MKQLLLAFSLWIMSSISMAQQVNVFVWSDAIPLSVLQQFEAETGIKVNFSTYDSTESMVAKLRASRIGLYDVVEPSSYYVPRMIRSRLLHPLDHTKIPNLKHIDPQLLDHAFDPANRYTIPFILGVTGIFRHTQYIEQPLTSWNDLWDDSLKNQLLLIDDAVELFSIALLSLGYPANSSDPEQLKQAYQKLRLLLPNIKLFGSDIISSILADEDAYAGIVWNGDVIKASRYNPHLQYVYPQEGAILFIDALAIPANAPNKENAYRFINFLLKPEVAEQVVLTFGFTTANKSAHELLPAEIRDNPSYYPSADVFQAGHFQDDRSEEAMALISRYWTLLKLEA